MSRYRPGNYTAELDVTFAGSADLSRTGHVDFTLNRHTRHSRLIYLMREHIAEHTDRHMEDIIINKLTIHPVRSGDRT